MTTSLLETTAAPFLRSNLASNARRIATPTARCALGLMFFVFGLNGFLNFIPPPAGPMPEGALAFGTALAQTGYMFPLIKGTEVLVGLLLLSNRFVALALTLLAPVVVNIFAFHFFLTPGESAIPAVIVVLQAYLAWTQRACYRSLFVARSG